jgi:hypothetical protein
MSHGSFFIYFPSLPLSYSGTPASIETYQTPCRGIQGILTEEEGSVQLTSLLWWLVL